MGSVDAVIRKAQAWAREEFGDADPQVVARKVLEEAEELRWDPEDAGEMADVILTVARLADVADVDLAAALEVRHGRNTESEWETLPDGRMSRSTDT